MKNELINLINLKKGRYNGRTPHTSGYYICFKCGKRIKGRTKNKQIFTILNNLQTMYQVKLHAKECPN